MAIPITSVSLISSFFIREPLINHGDILILSK